MSSPVPRRPRGRVPDPEKTAQTRRAIRDAALQSFLAHGFEGTRMADVAARAGLAKGTLYLHFADKEALFEFVLEEMISGPLALVRDEAGQAENPREALERLMLPLLRDFERSGRGPVLRLILTEGSRFPALAAMHRRLVIEPAMDFIRAQAQRAADAGNPAALQLVRYPQLAAAPVVTATLWNGLWSRGEQLDPALVFTAFLDLVFPKPG